MTTTVAERLTQPAPIRTVHVGPLRVTYLPDGLTTMNARAWLPTAPDGFWSRHSEYLDADAFVGSVGGLLIEYRERAMLIDAGFGPLTFRTGVGILRGGGLLDSLAQVGRDPAEIETVALTHLHADHFGWLWQAAPGARRPPFAHAQVLVSEDEWHHRALAAAAGTTAEMLDVFAPQVRTVADGDEIFPGVRVRALPGHTVGHTGFVIGFVGQRLIAFGDALHSSLQIAHPELSAVVDHDPMCSADVRHGLVEELAVPGTLGYGCHFADVQFGNAIAAAEGRMWQPHRFPAPTRS
ncbi:Glyoxylase, beta-lactamase superfamily II [Nocardia amikacinitolerans]|uniref:Glyoxylase, beta-lactamase superfamily II n=1 Tax=Nocardia amikacinitolerans TaxID=756689 RepID=A0A285LUE7_9NOCA|nr:MBL fold metallo-hydrolase [Nocardia amikacinitolerans]MCP2280676.1 Glyoxylase, beta-lactamase superfamily II [Nocardia amikacinitolerans]MCP2300088.1 Glyoxylase, beta-lactamase superfamily II [Nocardia amikacinitolerans]SNY88549.1 Glyoxylase, beta-lactamase superfamily II [Nocardia amikacinitolerans]